MPVLFGDFRWYPVGDLVGTVEIESEERWNAVASTDVCQRWWKYMTDVMPANPDNSPVSSELQEVFYLP
ncbi:L-rhamnose mutarotase [Escherichia coli]